MSVLKSNFELKRLAATERQKMNMLETIEQLRAERDALRKAIEQARAKLRSSGGNWPEECYFECDDILSAALEGVKP
jgi:hypothetical protein